MLSGVNSSYSRKVINNNSKQLVNKVFIKPNKKNISFYTSQFNDDDKAIEEKKKVIEIAEKHYGFYNDKIAQMYESLAYNYVEAIIYADKDCKNLNKEKFKTFFKQAYENYLKAIKIYQNLYGDCSSKLACTYCEFAKFLGLITPQKNNDLEILDRALRIFQQLNGYYSDSVAYAYSCIGKNLLKKKNYIDAEKKLLLAEKIYKDHLKKNEDYNQRYLDSKLLSIYTSLMQIPCLNKEVYKKKAKDIIEKCFDKNHFYTNNIDTNAVFASIQLHSNVMKSIIDKKIKIY